jgi:beta-galactosidase
MENILQGDGLTLGTCYYPEHWPQELWRSDLERMKENGIEVVRIAEFAWSKVEPREGEFTFAFFDSFLNLAAEMDMKVIFCTPTATPPAWLTHKYPEVLNATMEGVKYRHGARRHYNYNSPKYIELTQIIVEKFASHYGSHPNIIGWQIDNELNCELNNFYSESDNVAFREFLQEKYKDLDQLNKAWGTDFWNQMYTDWEEVYVPQKTVSDSTNPHRVLDYYRFISHSARKYAKLQADIIRKYIKADDFVTTNGMFGHLDNHQMTKESLDFYTYDSYPNFGYSLDMYDSSPQALRDRWWSRNLTETRSISSRFGIMEQQSGPNGWNTRMEAPAPRPGQLSLWTMQSIAHGADFISYFRWRTCTMGTEIYWHGILDYSNRDNRRLSEVKDLREKLDHMTEIAGAKYQAQVGIIKDYDNVWDAELDTWHKRVEKASQAALFEAAQLSHTPMDYLYLQDDTTLDDLKSYKVLFYPHATILTPERIALLEAYAEQGGTLVFGCRTGYKDLTGQCVMEKLPGLARKMTGADVYEYTFIAPDSETVTIEWDGDILEANIFLDLVEPIGDSAKQEGTIVTGDYPGSGALVSNTFGQGSVYYYGTAFTAKSAETFMKKLGVISPLSEIVTGPRTCEIAVRKKETECYVFILNFKKEKARVTFHQSVVNLYTGQTLQGDVELEGYGTLVVKNTCL